MNVIFKIVIFLLLFYSFNRTTAQELDSLKVSNKKYKQLLLSEKQSLKFLFYKHKNDVLLNNLGPFGSRSYYTNTKGIYPLKSEVELVDSLKHKFYQLKASKPFTNLSYVNASRNEQVFSLTHLQHLGNSLFLDFNYAKEASLGYYINQKIDNSRFQAKLKFKDRQNNYKAEFTSLISKSIHEVNSGIVDSLDFEENLLENRQTIRVNLEQSEVLTRKYRFGLKQKINLFKFSGDDTTDVKLFIGHKINYGFKERIFFDNDPLALIYDTSYISNTLNMDSLHQNNFSNKVYLGLALNNIKFNVFALRETKEYFQNLNIDTLYNNTYTGVNVDYQTEKMLIRLRGNYGVDGFDKGNLELALLWNTSLLKGYEIGLDAIFEKRNPILFFKNFSSNHYKWENYGFTPQSSAAINFKIKNQKYDLVLEANHKMITSLIYMDSLISPRQFDGQLSYLSYSIKKNYRLWNFYFRTALFYQKTSETSIAPLPELMARQVVYYQASLFKKKLKVQLGVNVSYKSGYKGYAYSAATGMFYTQERVTLGNYPYLDVFINTQIKRAQLFLKYEHINAGLSGYSYYATPNHPAMDGSFKFGISWNLFD